MNRLLVVGVIVLFLGLACAPSINADIKKDEKKIKPLDNGYFEIITYVHGYVWPLQMKWQGIFICGRLEMWEKDSGTISIEAYTLNPSNPFYRENPRFIYAPIFIGSIMAPLDKDYYMIDGKFLGNIYWE